MKNIALLNGVLHQVGSLIDFEFLLDVGSVTIHSAATDEKQVGNFTVGFAFGEELDDLSFPDRKRCLGGI